MSEEVVSEKRTSKIVQFFGLFAGLYFLLAFLPFPLSIPFEHFYQEPYYEWMKGYDQFFMPAAKWVAATFFHAAGAVILQPTGSGDTMYQNMMKLFWLGIAAIIALIWVLVDRKSKTFEKTNDLLRVNVRFFLVTILFGYGFGKLGQFPTIPDMSLDTTWGETSPMGVVWKMMMSNPNYTAFAGLLEAAPGFLLMFRRTANLGALLCLGVMFHIWTLNMFFDVPVKLHSLNYILMSLYLVSPMFGRLINVFLLNRSSEPMKLIPEVKIQWLRIATVVLATGYWGFFSFKSAQGWYDDVKELSSIKPPYVGSWVIRSYIVDGQEKVGGPDKDAWKGINIMDKEVLVLLSQENHKNAFQTKYDEPLGKIDLKNFMTEKKYKLTYQIEGENLTIQGDFIEGQTTIIARKAKADRVIFSKPFSWISEKPDNR